MLQYNNYLNSPNLNLYLDVDGNVVDGRHIMPIANHSHLSSF